jgi:hypothetical protein
MTNFARTIITHGQHNEPPLIRTAPLPVSSDALLSVVGAASRLLSDVPAPGLGVVDDTRETSSQLDCR